MLMALWIRLLRGKKMDNFNLSQEKLQILKDELRHLLNRLSIDNELGTPDFILAEMITEQINSMVVARRKTREHKGEGFKTIQLEFQGIDDCYMKDTAHYKFKSTLKKLSGESYTEFHDNVVDDLFEVILTSHLPAYKVVGIMSFMTMELMVKSSNNATLILMDTVNSVSVKCENFDFHERKDLQECLRDIQRRLRAKLGENNAK